VSDSRRQADDLVSAREVAMWLRWVVRRETSADYLPRLTSGVWRNELEQILNGPSAHEVRPRVEIDDYAPCVANEGCTARTHWSECPKGRRRDEGDVMGESAMYLVIRLEFDSMENQISSAIHRVYEGVTADRKTAVSFISDERSKAEQKKEWDGEYYPRWVVEELRVITKAIEKIE
jgi:hypothetical protein